jgi:polyisoprenoid-binding protein YceI
VFQRTLTATLFGLALVAGGAEAQSARWAIDASHSSATFGIRHMMVTTVRGQFNVLSGSVEVVGNDPTTAKVSVTIDAASIDTRDAKRDEHLRSADFFDVAKFPTLTFVSKKVERAANGKLAMTGDLTIRGVTREVVLDLEGPTAEVKDPWGNSRVGLIGTTTIDRKDYGLTWNKALETGGLLVGEDVTITIDVSLVKGK